MSAVETDNENELSMMEEEGPTVHDHLEMALQVASEQGMSTSELLGIFYFYTHSIAESYREEVMGQEGDADAEG